MGIHQEFRRNFDASRLLGREAANLYRYQENDLSWLRDQIVHHFTFLYGREVLNLETGQFEFDRLLDEGERDFGGYDALILWGTYPRLGVDERTQWDFYDDFPAGRRGLRTLIEQVHNRGVKVFIPFTPWDQSRALSGKYTHPDDQELAKLIQEIDADGVFLDTLSSLDAKLQRTVESARAGVAFCSEGRASSASLQSITCSWEQSQSRSWEQGNWTAVPERVHKIDMERFVFPEHRLFVVNRFATGKDRIRVIQRGFFNGTGWVVWQDVFGLALTYTPEETAFLKKCRTIFRSHRSTIWGPGPYPHLPTRVPGVYCNEFTGGGKSIWTFYNDNDHLVDEAVIQIARNQHTHFVDLWNEKEIELMPPDLLPVYLEPHSVGAVAEFPCILKYSPLDNQVSMAYPAPQVMLHFQHSASSSVQTVQAGIPCEIPTSGSQRNIRIQLVSDHEVLDQIVVANPSSGKGQKPNET
jgi:hypothetical protein